MLDSTFSCIFDAATGITVSAFLICVIAALALGIIMAAAYLWRNICTSGYAAAVAMLPAIVCVVIMMVGGSLGAGVAVAGTFSLVRFRSAPGTAREICGIFLAVAVGLACGMGYPGLAVLFAVIMVAAGLALGFMHFGEKKSDRLQRVLHITLPEDLDYSGIFDDIFEEYTTEAELRWVKTTNLGSLNKLAYDVTLKQAGAEKAFIDALRCRNGNLEISLSVQSAGSQDL